MSNSLFDELPGTVKPYEKHFFISTSADSWAPRIESGGDLVEEFVKILAAASQDLNVASKPTAFHDPSQQGDFRILCFPDLFEYRVGAEDFESWTYFYLSGGRVSDQFVPRPLSGKWFFVCTHGARDERCGNCGPSLLDALKKAIENKSPGGGSHIYGCSHIGGHRFAGNLLVYPEGDWYGLLHSFQVDTLVDHVREGKILWPYWRGRAGLALSEQVALAQTFRSSQPGN